MKLIHAICALAACFSLASCGNQPGQGELFNAVTSGALKKDGQGSIATPEQVAAAIDQSLRGTDLPLALAVIEKRNATAILTRIETNGPYGTWATPDRRTITLRGGLVTATRGLGNDIMSSQTDALRALIANRKAGRAIRLQRYLDGENHTVEMVADCTVTRGAQKNVKIAEIDARTIELRESCEAGATRFVNTYLVDARGHVVQSRQWLNPESGHIVIQTLRR